MIRITKSEYGTEIARLYVDGEFVFKATRVQETWIAMHKGYVKHGATPRDALEALAKYLDVEVGLRDYDYY